jgi:hypothetical protein
MRKLRKTGAVDQDGEPDDHPGRGALAGANKPPSWNRWGAAEKVEHLLGLSASTACTTTLSWSPDGLDPYRLAAQRQVLRRRDEASSAEIHSSGTPALRSPARYVVSNKLRIAGTPQ